MGSLCFAPVRESQPHIQLPCPSSHTHARLRVSAPLPSAAPESQCPFFFPSRCRISTQPAFWWFWMMSILSFSCSFEIVVRGSSIGVHLCHHLGFSQDTIFLNIFLLISERKDERESLIGCLLHAPHWGSISQHRHVLLTKIEPRILQSAGQCCIH
jgi:hypothetical protein